MYSFYLTDVDQTWQAWAGYSIVGYNVPFDTLYIILETVLWVR